MVTALVAAGAGAWAWHWRETAGLRTELEVIRTSAAELARMRAENQRLRAQQVSAEELARLRSDHEALPRLRAEVESVRARVEGRGR